jgi:hypothetical protein
MENFTATSGNRYSVDSDKVRVTGYLSAHVGELAQGSPLYAMVAPRKADGAPSGTRDVVLPMRDILEVALNYLRNEQVAELRSAEGDELRRLLGF